MTSLPDLESEQKANAARYLAIREIDRLQIERSQGCPMTPTNRALWEEGYDQKLDALIAEKAEAKCKA